MSLALHTHRASGFGRWLGHAAAHLIDAPARFVRHRRLLSTMAAMSDHELRDIGLSHADVNDATGLPFSSDLGLFLSTRASERARSAPRR